LKICINCFRKIQDDAKFCSYCGYPQESAGVKRCPSGHLIFEDWKDCPFCAQSDSLGKTIFEGESPFMGNNKTIAEIDKTKYGEDFDETELDLSSVGFFAWLVDITEGRATRDFRIMKERIFIGRDPSSDIVIRDEMVSKEHAAIYFKNGEFIIDDLNSKNGTFLNGELIERAKLRDGDVIKVGSREFLFKLLEEK